MWESMREYCVWVHDDVIEIRHDKRIQEYVSMKLNRKKTISELIATLMKKIMYRFEMQRWEWQYWEYFVNNCQGFQHWLTIMCNWTKNESMKNWSVWRHIIQWMRTPELRDWKEQVQARSAVLKRHNKIYTEHKR